MKLIIELCAVSSAVLLSVLFIVGVNDEKIENKVLLKFRLIFKIFSTISTFQTIVTILVAILGLIGFSIFRAHQPTVICGQGFDLTSDGNCLQKAPPGSLKAPDSGPQAATPGALEGATLSVPSAEATRSIPDPARATGPAYMRNAVLNTYLSAACQQAYNQIAAAPDGGAGPNTPQIWNAGELSTNVNGSTKRSYTPTGQGVEGWDTDLCGYYVRAAVIDTDADTAFSKMQNAAIWAAEADIQAFIPREDGGTWSGKSPPVQHSHATDLQIISVPQTATKEPVFKTVPPLALSPNVPKFKPGSIEAEVADIMASFEIWAKRLRLGSGQGAGEGRRLPGDG
jgi:hypothetical protein